MDYVGKILGRKTQLQLKDRFSTLYARLLEGQGFSVDTRVGPDHDFLHVTDLGKDYSVVIKVTSLCSDVGLPKAQIEVYIAEAGQGFGELEGLAKEATDTIRQQTASALTIELKVHEVVNVDITP